MVMYRNIHLNYNDEIFRLIRLESLIDDIYNTLPFDFVKLIDLLEDEKGTLKIYWHQIPTLFYRNLIDMMWIDRDEIKIKHIMTKIKCNCCNAPPQEEDPEIKEYLKSIQL